MTYTNSNFTYIHNLNLNLTPFISLYDTLVLSIYKSLRALGYLAISLANNLGALLSGKPFSAMKAQIRLSEWDFVSVLSLGNYYPTKK